MHSEPKRNEVPGIKFVYQLPFVVSRKLGILLDCNNDWRILGGEYMKFNHYELERISTAFLRRESPTEELLRWWGTKNNRVSQLFCFLAKMKHYPAMKELLPYVDKRYHRLIEESVSRKITNSTVLSVKPPTKKSDSDSRQCDEKPKQKVSVAAPDNQKNQSDAVKKPSTSGVDTHTIDYKELGTGLPFIDYKILQESTNNWSKSNILGHGGFGVVYIGVVKQTPMAIKRLIPRRRNKKMNDAFEVQLRDVFKELKYLDSNRHDNILPLYGYSYRDDNFCLVSQIMINGSLEDRLLCRNHSLPLSARSRCNIARGTARGLQFLHDREKPLIHGDIKSANILLDRLFEPKIGDFGLSREGPSGKYSYVQVSQVHGSTPYLPDEFLRGNKLSVKVDTHSFGVVLFEIITGLQVYDENRSEKFLKDHILKLSEENNLQSAIDPRIGFEYFALFASYVFTLAKACVSYRPRNRPTMMEVCRSLDHLNAHMEIIDFQRPPNYYIDPSIRSVLYSSAASTLAKPVQIGTHNLSHQQSPNYQRTPSPTNPVARAAPTLQKVLEEAVDKMSAAEVSSTSEISVQTTDSESDSSHVSIDYEPLAESHTNSNSEVTEVTTSTSGTKSNSIDQDCGKCVRGASETLRSDEIPLITELENLSTSTS